MSPSKRLGRPVPASLESLVLAALAKSPDNRPESAVAFGLRLAACADVPAWTEADAAAWWRDRGDAIKKECAGSADAKASAAPRTLAIDREAADQPAIKT